MMRTWLTEQWDWLLAGVFIAIATSTVIGFKDGAKGGAIFVSNTAAAIMALVMFPFLSKHGYGSEWVGLLGLFCGGAGMALFGVLTAVSTAIDRRREKLADQIINRVAPEDKRP
jgi:hypothetical protein